MDPRLGEFITNEYGLLKQILLYLKPRDLYNARLVCREWQRAVDNLVDRSPIVISYKHDAKDPMHYAVKPILPDLVIYQNVISREFMKLQRCKSCNLSFLVCYCDVTGPETEVLSLNNLTIISKFDPEAYLFWQMPSLFVLSSKDNMKISTFYCENNQRSMCMMLPRDGETLPDLTEPIKGVFVIAKNYCRKGTESLLNEIVDRQGPTFAVGGGMTDAFFYKRRGLSKENKHCGIYVFFKGDNISAHSDILIDRDRASMERCLLQLQRRAGDVPEGATRIAFITQCVDRKNVNLERTESGLFRKYFPNVPQCGFSAWGEFGFKSGSSGEPEPTCTRGAKRKKLIFSHSYTTTILIVTIKKS